MHIAKNFNFMLLSLIAFLLNKPINFYIKRYEPCSVPEVKRYLSRKNIVVRHLFVENT